jgi:hypothetical protein
MRVPRAEVVITCRKNVFDIDLDEIGGYFYRAGVWAATRTGRLFTLSLNSSLQELKMAGTHAAQNGGKHGNDTVKKWRESREYGN